MKVEPGVAVTEIDLSSMQRTCVRPSLFKLPASLHMSEPQSDSDQCVITAGKDLALQSMLVLACKSACIVYTLVMTCLGPGIQINKTDHRRLQQEMQEIAEYSRVLATRLGPPIDNLF